MEIELIIFKLDKLIEHAIMTITDYDYSDIPILTSNCIYKNLFLKSQHNDLQLILKTFIQTKLTEIKIELITFKEA